MRCSPQTLQVPIKYGVAILGEEGKKRELTCAASHGRGASLPAADRVTDSSLFEIFTRSLTADIESEREVNGAYGWADWRVPKAIPNTRALGCPRRDCVYRSAGSKRRAQRSGLWLLLSTELSDGCRAPTVNG